MYGVDFKKFTGTSKLFLDFIGCNEPAFHYFRHDFREAGSYRRAAENIDKNSYPREKVASILTEAASSFGISANTRDNISKLARSDSLCVFAGQQVGILLGPMYTILKALTAYKLAKKLETELGRPVVPCFWMASDDHDFDEIKTASFLDRQGNCEKISYEPLQPPHGEPVADIMFDSEIDRFLNQVEENLIDTEFKENTLRALRSIYRSGRGMTGAFAELFEKILGDFGIVPVDPNYPGLKPLLQPLFEREIENHDSIFNLFDAHSKEILKSGYHRQVHKSADSLSLFFNNGARRNILYDAGYFAFDGQDEKLSKPDLLNLLGDSPDKFSPNVILRPIAQCFVFPVVSQIVGPSEAAYFAQIGPLFDYHHVPWPVIRPRLFATLVEPQVARIISKLSIDFAGLANDMEFEAGRVIRENFPPQVRQDAENLRSFIEKPLFELAEPLKNSDSESYQAIEHARRRIDHELNHLSRKLIQAHTKKHDDARQRVFKVASFLFPCANFQERVLSPIYFANKFGPSIFKLLEEHLDIDSVSHQMVEIEV
jgi:bacillithiol biosynthesis cysteine-adding enzyme BshC